MSEKITVSDLETLGVLIFAAAVGYVGYRLFKGLNIGLGVVSNVYHGAIDTAVAIAPVDSATAQVDALYGNHGAAAVAADRAIIARKRVIGGSPTDPRPDTILNRVPNANAVADNPYNNTISTQPATTYQNAPAVLITAPLADYAGSQGAILP